MSPFRLGWASFNLISGDYLAHENEESTTQIFPENQRTGLIFLRCFPPNCLCLLRIIFIIRVGRMPVPAGSWLSKVSKGTCKWTGLSGRLLLWPEGEGWEK